MARGNANTVMLLVFCILAHYKIASATTYTVGDALGWSFNPQSWTNGKQFHAGDILVFKYSSPPHSVAVVDKNGFDKCNAGGAILTSGNDQIKLKKGQNYFICGNPAHCAGGMKMIVTAT